MVYLQSAADLALKFNATVPLFNTPLFLWLYRELILSPYAIMYLEGWWGGLSQADICSSMTNTDSEI